MCLLFCHNGNVRMLMCLQTEDVWKYEDRVALAVYAHTHGVLATGVHMTRITKSTI